MSLKGIAVLLSAAIMALGATDVTTPPPGCKGSSSLGTFRILVRRSAGGAALPIKAVSTLPAGAHLIWEPVHPNRKKDEKTEVTAILVPAVGDDLVVLESRKAGSRAEWQIAASPAAIAFVVGPQGFSIGKVKSLVTHNRQLVEQLADYADQTSKVEGLMQEVSNAEQSGGGIDSALKGFSARFGVALPKLDAKTSTDQQASVLLKTLLPSAGAYDPLAAKSAQMQQSGGLAASIAGLFFGNAVGLAAGGAALLQEIKGAVFPSTEFHSAFAQNDERGGLALCMKAPAQKTRTRVAYLWAYRVPNHKPPVVSLVGPSHLPAGLSSAVAIQPALDTNVKLLEKARDWRLVPIGGGAVQAVTVRVGGVPNSIDLDLTQAKVQPGEYKLFASWDWDLLEIAVTLQVEPLPDLSGVKLSEKSRQMLIEGRGSVTVSLSGADFEFLEKVVLTRVGEHASAPVETHFQLPLGKRAGVQTTVDVNIDTAARGAYRLLLAQSGGGTREVPLTVLPPNPVFSGLPVKVNLEETSQVLRLEGKQLDRIEAISSDAGDIKGAATATGWVGSIGLKPGIRWAETFAIYVKVKGIEAPLLVEDAIKIFGPRPSIFEVKKSLPAALGLSLHANELPAGTPVGLALAFRRFHGASPDAAEARPHLELGCKSGGLRKTLMLSPDNHIPGAELSVASAGMLFLSIDPSMVGYPGCVLTATIDAEPEGRSDAYPIGRIIRIPHIDQFTLTSEQLGPSTYLGILKGRDLDVIEKTGWDAQYGMAADSVPTPVPGDPSMQTMRISLPWPAPSPHAPLYVWLRGETEGRRTSANY
jgi:hypothetical protein